MAIDTVLIAPPENPSRTDPDNFRTEADAWVDWLTNTFHPNMVTIVTEINESIDEVNESEAAAISAKNTAVATSNFIGAWSSLSAVAGTVGQCVLHNSTYWILLVNVADITAVEPGVDSEWAGTLPYPYLRHVTRSSNAALLASDQAVFLRLTAAFTQTIASISTLPSDWFVYIENASTSTVTIDPDAAETIDGAASISLYPGEIKCIFFTGSALLSTSIRVNQRMLYSARTSNTEISANDHGTFIDITSGTFSQTFASVAALPAGWFVYLRNSGTGVITLDPTSTETIDGLTAFIMHPGETRLINSTGSAFESIVLTPFTAKRWDSSGTFAVPPGYSSFWHRLASGSGGGGSGGRYADTVSQWGGKGGGGGGVFEGRQFDATAGGTVTVTIGAGGTGGPAQTSDSTAGTAGTAGGNTSLFGAGFSITVAGGLGGGYGNTSSQQTGANGGGVGITGAAGFLKGAAGGGIAEFGGSASGHDSATSGVGMASGASVFGGGAGGHGAGYSTSTPTALFAGGASTYGGNGGSGGNNGADGSDGTYSATLGSGGGGGGGGSQNGTNSGAGGDGKDGHATIIGEI